MQSLLIFDVTATVTTTIEPLLAGKSDSLEWVHAGALDDAERCLQRGRTDVALVTFQTLADASSQTTESTTVSERLQRLHAAAGSVPVIVLVDSVESEAVQEAFAAGAAEVLPVAGLTDSAITQILKRCRQQSEERHRLKAEISRLEEQIKESTGFVDHVSHEFRTPLTVIREYSSLMLDGLLGDLTEDQQEFVDVISDRSDDLSRMVDDLLDASKMSQGVLGLSRESACVADIFEQVRPGLERKSEVRQVALTLQSPEDMPDVFCDAEKAGRVLTNLAINAIKFAGDPGEVRIWSTCHPDRGEVRVQVQDNGPGLEQADRDLLFQRFRQLGISTQSSTKGFGLGLNIARDLVDMNFGEILIESTPGAGSTFSFTLPLNSPKEIVRRYLTRLDRLKRTDDPDAVSCISVRCSDRDDQVGCDEINMFWRYSLRRNDLVIRTRSDSWTLLLPIQAAACGAVIDRMRSEHTRVSRNRPLGALPPLEFDVVGSFDAQATDTIMEAVDQTMVMPVPFQAPEDSDAFEPAAVVDNELIPV